MFRAKQHWIKNRNVKYKHITTATLEKFRQIAIECKLEDIKQLHWNFSSNKLRISQIFGKERN